ncbi:MAG: hypothetical protein WC959_11275 [Kiritimatiellales bacterium]
MRQKLRCIFVFLSLWLFATGEEKTVSEDMLMNNNIIKLTDILPIGNPAEYKLHLGCPNSDGVNPLNEYVKDKNNWKGWNEWQGNKNVWTRKYIFSFIEFPSIANAYLFAGVFEVKERLPKKYILEECPEFSKWDGRLICKFYRCKGLRGRAFNLERFIDSFDVLEVLPEQYTGEIFCGYTNVNHSFSVLQPIVQRERRDWQSALSVIKGVYLISDTTNGKVYVGSAYGDSGVWSRLQCYVGTGHGWHDARSNSFEKKELSTH